MKMRSVGDDSNLPVSMCALSLEIVGSNASQV